MYNMIWLVVALICFVWSLVPPLLLFAWILRMPFDAQIRRHLRLPAIVVFIAWLPALGAMLGWWQFDIFLPFIPTGRITSTAKLPNYDVTFVSNSLSDEFFEHFEVTRSDGKKATVYIDGDASKCVGFYTKQENERTYFICEDGGQPSYVDKARQIVYAGYEGRETALKDLEFK